MKKKIVALLSLTLVSLFLLSMDKVSLSLQDPWEVPAEYQKLENPYSAVKDRERIGLSSYAKYCKSCHGNKGRGDGVNSKLLTTPVADFTGDTFKSQTDGSLYYKIYKGRNEMPGFERIITEEEDLWLLVNYIKNL